MDNQELAVFAGCGGCPETPAGQRAGHIERGWTSLSQLEGVRNKRMRDLVLTVTAW